MFNLRLDNPSVLKQTVAVLSDFITEATFAFGKNGIKLIAMDPANICMVNLDILPSLFSEYVVEQKKEVTLNLGYLQQALNRARSSDAVTLSLEKNKLKLTILGKSTKRFFIPLLEKEGKERTAPDLDFNANIEMDADEFRDYVDDAAIVGDAITFELVDGKLNINAGETGSKVHIDVKKDSDAVINFELKENARSIFSAEYLKKIASSAKLTDTVVMNLSNDYPTRLDFKALNKLRVQFILAPRIENQ